MTTLWQQINEKWDTLPADSKPEEFKARLMLHLVHAFAFTTLAVVGWGIYVKLDIPLWVPLATTLLMFAREAIQRATIKERWWSCVFDTVQVTIVWPVVFLMKHEWWAAAGSLVAVLILYVAFLLGDKDWIEE